MTEGLEPYPKPHMRDHVRTGTDAAIAAIPFVGGSVQILVDGVISPSLDRRRDLWFQKLAELVAELEQRVEQFDAADLIDDERFVTGLIQASRIAMGTHLEDKIDLLKNCLARMAIEPGRDDFLDLQYFRMVDDFSPQHFVVLQYLASPGAWFDSKGIERPVLVSGSPSALFAKADLPLDGLRLQLALKDLADRGLAELESLEATMSARGMWQSMVTELGQGLLHFVMRI